METYEDVERRMQELLEEANRQAAEITEVQQKISKSSTTGESANGMITVTVRGNGKITDVKIDPDAVKYYDSKTLGSEIVQAINNAQRQSMSHARDMFHEVMPDIDLFDKVLDDWAQDDEDEEDKPRKAAGEADFRSW